ncbi:tRNA pseudouridine(55) synthase TruB [Erythrobacter rubeus]|uniref:tRNA pseudouridine synthase B n=1 Tax=Erythrobacter rubeus TaxID=2760803 RepID=A0ABR8KPC9_9SPHN|nr:tRNA pseudouridine(55) synthase TruB [Erythrobacter rubeus]MBD2841192.1 tRNA pseudouridine(55) synthase TruB [Erythrobacter rubeus]
MTEKKPPPHGWIILDKPRGLGSTQAVAAVKRNLREGGYAKTKVGHGGTLDPLAEGVLPIALGEATKLAGRMLDASKIYEFTIRFGEETDTLDTEGEVVERSEERPSLPEVEAVLPQFTGPIEQVPPAYSALKVDGKRAYDRARAGEAVALKKRSVTIHSLEVCVDAHMPEEITFTAHVSKGTYIRSLARDIARALGTCGHVTYLRRIKAGPFLQDQAISLDNLNEIGSGAPLKDLLLPLEAGLDDIPALILDQTSAQAVRQGRVLSELPQPSGLYCAMLDNVPVALMEIMDGAAKVVRGFNLPDVAE